MGALVLVGALAAFLLAGRSSSGGPENGLAPPFTLPSTNGRTVSLSDFRGRNVLLYFSEGVGCDACFYQMQQLEANAGQLSRAGLTVVPIVVNPATDVRREMARFGLRTPFLIDSSEQVSAAYKVIGTGMHANLPGHTFVLVDGNGRVRWEMSYPSMFASTRSLLATLRPYLGPGG